MKLQLDYIVLAVIGGVILTGLVSSCDVPSGGDVSNEVPIINSDQRFTVTKHGTFNAGFDNNVREIIIITDTTTKRTYLGITGVGVSEMRSEQSDETTYTRER